MHHLRRLLQWARTDVWGIGTVVGMGLIVGFMTVLQAYLFAQILNAAFIQHQGRVSLYVPLALLLGVMLGRAGAIWGSEVAAQRVAVRIKARLRRTLLEAMLRAGPAYLKTRRTGNLIATALQGVESLEPFFAHYVPQVVLAAGVPLLVLEVVFPLDWLTGLVFLATAPLIPLFMMLIGRMVEQLTRRQWRALQRLNEYILDTLQGLVSLKAMGRVEERGMHLGRVSDAYYTATLAVLRMTFLSALVMELISTLSTALVAVQVGLRLLYGRLDFLHGFFILLIAPEFYLPLRMLGQRFHAAMSGVSAAQTIFALLDEAATASAWSRVSFVEGKSSQFERPLAPPQRIRFEDVDFIYPGRPEMTLQGITFEIRQGQKVALIGPSGAGKTTLAYLLLGFLQPSRGQITIDGRPLSQIPFEEWRNLIAWVPQNPYIFNASLAWNVCMADLEAPEEALVAVGRQAFLVEILERHSQAWDTMVGERGAGLSGGEAQRVALARAFLKNAPLLVMDEPTAHLDPDLEVRLEQMIHSLWQGRTSLIIAHRLGTIQNADWVLVLEGGRIVEQGTPADLLAQKGCFYSRVMQWRGL
ncbi:thiol reductant ABC exporter subunit CydD [uncultured Thermanaerothrix sp.]|uniref:thiol reductant ABC exporter subunit CydD n=1 Tax=uncultured Thermanaerothrix sp. TaxID=1195149 RepID=UPI0026144740|nr:thiol reductant ABC exporter subunit CydD [uncultured Thermanaerothrix sp.]